MNAPRGMTFIDVVVGTALMLIIFLGLLGILRASALVSTLVKSETTATTIANNQMEYIRSLSYDQVGTLGGIPSGTIAQNATTTEGGSSYGVRTFIEYYDDPADGVGASDTNGITTDYKIIKVTVSYYIDGRIHQLSLISNYAPAGLETTTNGGTLQVAVVNSAGAPVPGASVRIVNASTSPTVDVTTFSDSVGMVYLPGAATSTQYQVTVSKSGYSTAQTYARTITNQNPSPGYLTVAKNLTTSSTFAIDLLGTLVLSTYSPTATSTFSDAFSNSSKLTNLTNVVVTGNALTLSGLAGNYSLAGSAVSVATSSNNITSWGMLMATTTTPANTAIVLHVVDSTGALLPDSVLPGNAAGFSSFPVRLYGISTTTYPSLAISANLSTTDQTVRPSVTGWSISYGTAQTPLPNVSFALTGAKTIGSTGAGAPIYKTTLNSATGSTGTVSLPLEWDSYSLALSGYDAIDACSAPPYALSAGTTLSESLTLGTATTNAVLVTVTDSTGVPLSNAVVTLSRSGYSKTVTTSACGTAYFGNLTSATDYTIGLAKTGYTTTTIPNVSISNHVFYTASF